MDAIRCRAWAALPIKFDKDEFIASMVQELVVPLDRFPSEVRETPEVRDTPLLTLPPPSPPTLLRDPFLDVLAKKDERD